MSQGLVVIPTDSATPAQREKYAAQEVTEVAFALSFNFADEDYEQMLTDIAGRLGPALGSRPRA